jgi:hypothetical protein
MLSSKLVKKVVLKIYLGGSHALGDITGDSGEYRENIGRENRDRLIFYNVRRN